MAIDYTALYLDEATRYDRLVSAEDCDGTLLPAIEDLGTLATRRVLEVGAGTGRITRLLCGAGARVMAFDRALPMLDIARQRLAAQRDSSAPPTGRWSLAQADAAALPVASGWAELTIAGWVFGHFCSWMPDGWKSAIAAALGEMSRASVPGTPQIIIETLGTGTETAAPPTESLAEYYEWLETEHGFRRRVLRTDYRFASVDEAAELCEFFFGPELAGRIRRDKRRRVPECTGLWWRST